jgi:3-hydroxyisobutyrate dehydrogenase-like beta-hydroxyacid dehydrogenase
METLNIGVLHPGAMGAQVAAQAVAAGHRVHWLPQGRGEATGRRARAAGLVGADSLAALAQTCDLLVSVCPPAAARDVAESVAATAFSGVYLEANAISPRHTVEIAELFGGSGSGSEPGSGTGVTVVDGGIVGPPPQRAGSTVLYLSGDEDAAGVVRRAFEGGFLAVKPLGGEIGKASALKLAFASYNKITFVLAAQACALAAGYGVLEDLLALGGRALAGTPLGRPDSLSTAAARAWRWAPEMREIADACATAGVSPDLARIAAELFENWDRHKDEPDVPLDRLIGDFIED